MIASASRALCLNLFAEMWVAYIDNPGCQQIHILLHMVHVCLPCDPRSIRFYAGPGGYIGGSMFGSATDGERMYVAINKRPDP